MLTGKCKGDFEKWLIEKEHESCLYTSFLLDIDYGINGEIPFSMQYGVYVDWFDSVGIELVVFKHINEFNWFVDGYETEGYEPTRQEARAKAIEKANEIYNVK